MGEKLTSSLALGKGPSEQSVREAERIVNAVFEFAKKYTAEVRDTIVALANELDKRTDMTGPEVIKLVESFPKPRCPTLKGEIYKIVARMKEEERQKKLEEMALASGFKKPHRAEEAGRDAAGDSGRSGE